MSSPINSNSRAVAHFDLDSFFVSVERVLNPELIKQPLIVGWKSKRGVVAACSYETRKFGVHSAMPMSKALKLCPQGIVIPPTRGAYSKYSSIVTQLIAGEGLPFEKASIDEFYLEYTGVGDFNECYVRASRLREYIIQQTGLPISFALSVNKLVSKIAVDTVKPNGQIEIAPGTEKDFLAPMQIEKIPMVGKETATQLHKMGIFTISQLAAASKDTLRTFLGKHGQALIDKAQGIDLSPVSGNRSHKSISTETTFEEDLTDPKRLEKELLDLNAQNAAQLRKAKYFASCVAIKMRFNDFETITRQITIPPTTSESIFRKKIKYLFAKYYPTGKKVRLLGIRYSGLIRDGFQMNLFENYDSQDRLNEAIDQLKQRYGRNSIKLGEK